ncbi:MAG: DUF4286 family protein [Dehalococcoidia bacterium]|nr:DUF4286 family protein [Dehalococcoidia bacterium]MDW8119249.1 DUF4286 family protein [Chloroflexota bacterium]
MEGRYPAGIRFVTANCTDPLKEEEFNRWYDSVHLADMLATRLVTHPTRYRNADPLQRDARYLAIYEVEQENLLEKIPHEIMERFTPQWIAQGRMHPALQVVARWMWRRIGPSFTTAKTGRAPITGLYAVQSHCANSAQEREFNEWYNTIHVPDILSTGLFHTAYRFEAVLPQPGQDRYLALYETDAPDPLLAVREMAEMHRPRWIAGGRFSPLLQVTWRGVYQRIPPPGK